MTGITILFVRKDSVYKTLNVDCYDVQRDASTFTGDNVVVCHPPCRAWSRLKHFSKPLPGEKELAIFSLMLIRENGGILEHPAGSSLWPACGLPRPGVIDEWGGYTLRVDQHWWGHKAQKKTLLYIVGLTYSQLPPIPIRFDAIEYVVSTTKTRSDKKEIKKSEREHTPVDFAKWLIAAASIINELKSKLL